MAVASHWKRHPAADRSEFLWLRLRNDLEALHLPETVGPRRRGPLNAGTLNNATAHRLTELDKQRLEIRSHVLTLREDELDSRSGYRDCTIEELNLRIRERKD